MLAKRVTVEKFNMEVLSLVTPFPVVSVSYSWKSQE